MRQISCRVTDELHAAIESARGDTPREPWMRRVLAVAASEGLVGPVRRDPLTPTYGRTMQRGSPSPSLERFVTPKTKR